METVLYSTSLVDIYHIELDQFLPDNLIFSERSNLRTLNMLAKLPIEETIAGEASVAGYTEGTGQSATFNLITGFVQTQPFQVVVVDYGNNCLRQIDRETKKTSVLVGNCTKLGYRDGFDALFTGPWSVVVDKRDASKLIVTDRINHALRLVDTLSKEVSTLIKSNDVHYPAGLYFSKDNFLYIAYNHFISQYSLNNGVFKVIMGSKEHGHSADELSQTLFNVPYDIVGIDSDFLVVADRNSNVLRFHDLRSNTVTEICSGGRGFQDGEMDKCKLLYPSAVAYINGDIYVGQYGAIRKLEIK